MLPTGIVNCALEIGQHEKANPAHSLVCRLLESGTLRFVCEIFDQFDPPEERAGCPSARIG